MSQHHNWRRTMLLFGAFVAVIGSAVSQDNIPDPRVLSIHYWQSFIDRGIVEGNPVVPVEPAIYTRSTNGTAVVPNDPDVLITGTLTNTTQSENSVFVDPLNNMRALNSNNSTNWPFSTLYGTSRYQTTDDGASWTGTVTSAGNDIGDPAAAIGRNGYFYIGHISTSFGQAVTRSTDGGTTWTVVTLVSGGTLDKNHLWVDNTATSPYEGQVYSAWTNFTTPYGAIQVSRSTNDGTSWTTVGTNVSSGVAAGSHNQGVNLQTGPGGEVYAVYAAYDVWAPPYNETAIGFSKSTNGGTTWTTGTRIQTILGIRGQGSNLGGAYPIRLASFPVMAVDRSGGPRNGYIYVVWTQRVNVTNGSWDTYIINSTDGGTTWSPRVLVGTEPSATSKKEFYPWITCDDVTGNLSVIRYDNRNWVTSVNQVEVWLSESTDGGATWVDSQLSDVMFTPAAIPGLAGGYMGDYISVSALNGRVHPVWTSNQVTPVRAYSQSHDFGGGGGGGGIPCGDISSFQARCITGGTIRARITMTDATHAGEMVEFTIDGTAYPATIVTGGTGVTRAQIAIGGFPAGAHTVELTDPAGCFSPVVTTCATADEAEIGWEDENWTLAEAQAAPVATKLMGNYPNPFNPTTSINYALSEDGFVSLKIYNTLGEEVATLVNEYQVAGIKSAVWSGRNESGLSVASGIYVYRLTTGNVVLSEKMLFMK